MGNSAPSLKGLDQRFQELGLDENELLSTLIVVKDTQSQEKLLIKQINIASEAEYIRLLKQLRQRKVHSSKKIGRYLLRVRDVEGRQQSQICGKSFKLLIYLEYISGTLKTVFAERVRTRRGFDEEELLSLLKSVVSGLIILHDNSFRNIHLCKEAILVTSENTYKIMDTQLCNRIHPYFQILNGVPPKAGTYLAPELLSDIRKGIGEFYPSPKADLFTLGVIILQMAALQPMDPYYDYEQKCLDIAGLQRKALALHTSQFFKKLLLSMLEEQEEERIGLLSLKEMLTGGIQTQPNEELIPYNSITELSRNQKDSSRTFISRSKQGSSRPQSTQQTSKDQHIPIPSQSQQVSQYNTHFHLRAMQPSLVKTNEQVHVTTMEGSSRHSLVLPKYVPIEANLTNNPQRIERRIVIQTPRSEVIHQFKIQSTKQFETPVNLLLQTQQQAVHGESPQGLKHEAWKEQKKQQQNTNHVKVNQPEKAFEEKETQYHHNKLKDLFSSKDDVLSSKSEVVFSKSQIFNNKSYGQVSFGNGARYEGEFNSQGQFEGNGILYYPNGKPCYSGSWKANAFHGFGVLHNENPQTDSERQTPYWNLDWQTVGWAYYEGQFKMDKKEGFGTLYLSNGDKFSGCFKDDAIEGFGSFFKAKEEKYINGIWIKNVLKH